MASIYTRDRSPRYWAKFRGAEGSIRRVATPYTVGDEVEEAKALAWALRAEELATAYRETGSMDSLEDLVRHGGERLEVLARAMAGAAPAPKSRELTMHEALERHHATQRLRKRADSGEPRAAAELRRHHRSIELFATHVGSESARAITLPAVLDYVENLRERGYAWDTRRHHILAIRRASASDGLGGRPDPLAGHRIDSRQESAVGEEPETPQIYTAGQLRVLWDRAAGNPQLQIGVGLMGFAGLRPSELIRLQARDWNRTDKFLRVGVRERKNVSSRRDLPLPQSVARLIHRQTQQMEPEEYLISVLHYPGRGKRKAIGRRPLAGTDLPKWWRNQMEGLPAADKDKGEEDLPVLPAKTLRKAWVSAAMWDLDLPERLIDLYMGHKSPDLSPVTTGHYLSRVTRRLAEVAKAFQTLLADD